VFYPVHTCPIKIEQRCHNCAGKAGTGFDRITQDT
jgi:hypothetical protein